MKNKIVIVGPGAMGCLFTALLSRNPNNEIWLLDKNYKRAKYIQEHGIKVTGLSKIDIPPEKIKITTDSKKIGIADLVIVFVKSYDTQSAIKNALPCIGTKTLILTLQNGLNNLETIKKCLSTYHLPLTTVFTGITSHGATLIEWGKIRHAGIGKTMIGKKDNSKLKIKNVKLKKICNIFNNIGIKTKIIENINSAIWSKLIINSSINPLGAITQKKNGELIKSHYIKKILCDTAEESAKVAKKIGIKLLYSNPSKKVVEVCKKTSNNYNSMLQDILHHKKTEIEHINGAIIQHAEKYKLEIPLNKILYFLVKSIEGNYQKV